MRYLAVVDVRIMKVGFKVKGKEIPSVNGVMIHRKVYVHEVYLNFSVF